MLSDKKFNGGRFMVSHGRIWGLLLIVLLICACATPAYKDVFKEKPAYNSRTFAVNKGILHQATLRAFCGRNFIIEEEDKEKGSILAKRSFQRGKRTIVLILQANASLDAAESSTLFLNAVETTERHYVADRTRFFLWLIPLPGGGGKQGTSVKEGERIIEDKAFYKNFFAEIDAEAEKLKVIEASRKREEEILAVIEAPQAEESVPVEETAIEEISEELVEEIISQEAIAPEMVVPETTPEEVVANETVREIPVQEETLPVEENITDQPSPGQ